MPTAALRPLTKKVLLVSFFLLVAVLFGMQSGQASAFQAGRIMEDAVFYNHNRMSPDAIRHFINARVPVCDTHGTQPYAGTTRANYGTSRGYPPPYVCLKNYTQVTTNKPADSLCNGHAAGHKSSARIIYDVAKSCGINPQVLLVLLQKEQSLVTDTWPWSIQYQRATGYACPDSAPCNEQYAGFFNQVYEAARAFKRYRASPNNYNYRAQANNNILFHPNAACGSSNVFIHNQATAGLYIYTPYQPNSALLAGSPNGCSSYGNLNFWNTFRNWFGSTHHARCTYPTDDRDGVYRLMQPNTNAYFLTSSPSEVCTATATMGYHFDGRLFYPSGTGNTPIYRLVKNSRYLYTASATERNNAVNNHGFRLDGVAFHGSATYDENTAPTPVYRLNYPLTGGYLYTVSLTEANEAVAHMGFVNEGVVFYTNNDEGKSYPHNVFRLSRAGSGYLMTTSTVERNAAIQVHGYRDEGVGFNTRIGFTTDNLPVYRMARPGGYLFTTSLSERKRAMRLGFRSEGIAFFGYHANYLGAQRPVYRLSHRNGTYLYTISAHERDVAVQNYGYRYEGVGFRVP